jgi:RNA polymerase-binding transcription factor DksA
MATKKQVLKPARPTGGKAVKAAVPAKKAPAKSVPAAAKKSVPPKKLLKPAPKKAAPKKLVPVKVAPKKAVAPPKKAAPPAKHAPHPAVKAVVKPVAKPIAKPAPAPVAKKPAEPAHKVEPAHKAVPAKPAAKAAPVKAAPAPVKQQPEPVKKPAVSAPTHQEVKPAIKPLEKPAPKKEDARPTKVVIPKTSTTRAVKYAPDFTRSVLDAHAKQQEQTGPTMRYSDAELVEFRELITKKLDTAKKELAYLQGLITRKDEGGDMEDGRYMTMEDGSMSMEREQLSQMASRQIQFIDHLEKAMMRIENKTYGVCRVTGKLIDKARLRAVPHATLSIEAKQMMNK